MVLRSYDVPTRLRSPSSTFHLLFEQICYRRGMSGPDQLLLFLGEITCKGRDAVTFQPNASVCNLDMGKISVAGNFSRDLSWSFLWWLVRHGGRHRPPRCRAFFHRGVCPGCP